MPKKQFLTPAKVRQLGKIRKDKNLQKNLTAFHQKWGKGYTFKQIRDKWYHLQKKTLVAVDTSGSLKSHKTVHSSKVTPYVLEKGVIVTARGDQKLKEEVMKRIKPSLLAMGIRTGTLPIYKTDQRAFRDLVKEPEFSGMVFGLTKIPDNDKMVRIYRKM